MKTISIAVRMTALIAALTMLLYCKKPGVQDGPALPDSAHNKVVPGSSPTSDTLDQSDTVDQSDSTDIQNDSIPKP